MTKLKLYHLEDCPYSKVVRKKFQLLGLSVELIPVAQNRKNRHKLRQATGQESVPALVDDEVILTDYQEILNYLKDKYEDGKSAPFPANDYGLRVSLEGSLEEVKKRTEAALKEVGFGVLTEIDVKATLKKKLDVQVPDQLILGACNPQIAHQAMDMEPDLGLLLPCNVVIREKDDNSYWVSAINPVHMLSVVSRDDMLPLAGQVKELLEKALESLKEEQPIL